MTAYHENKSILLQPQNRLDLEGGVALKHQLQQLEPNRHSLWIIDLTCVEFIDSSGLIALIAGLNLAIEHHCRMVLHNPHPSVRLVFEITRLDQIFEIIGNPADKTGNSAYSSVPNGLTVTGRLAA